MIATGGKTAGAGAFFARASDWISPADIGRRDRAGVGVTGGVGGLDGGDRSEMIATGGRTAGATEGGSSYDYCRRDAGNPRGGA